MLFDDQYSQSLEDSFFLAEDKKLREQLATMKAMEETRESLQAVSGITNVAVLDKLIALDIPPHIVASLSMIPLVEIAWADASVSDKERNAILAMASDDSPIDRVLLASWLTHKPSKNLLDAWIHYVEGICENLSASEKDALKHALLDQCEKVAQSDGGFFGLGSISKEEQAIIKQLESAFD